MAKNWVVIIGILLPSLAALARICPNQTNALVEGWKLSPITNVFQRFSATGSLVEQVKCADGLVVSEDLHRELSNGQREILKYVYLDGERLLASRLLHSQVEPATFWVFNLEINRNLPIQKDHIDKVSGRVVVRETFGDLGELLKVARFSYDDSGRVRSVKIIDGDGKIETQYERLKDFDLERVYKDFPHREAVRRLNIAKKQDRTKVAVIDTGIRMDHPELAYKLFFNHGDVLDSLDNDGNGLVDDFIGVVNHDQFIPAELAQLPAIGLPDLSHGTLVTSLLVSGREDIAVVPMADIRSEKYAELHKAAKKFILSHSVRFSNMSFGLDEQQSTPESQVRTDNLKDLIASTPQTLHFVAAGNGGRDLDRSKYSVYPAVFEFDNMLVVGSVETSELKQENYKHMQMSSFSNYGLSSVDLLAPGSKMCGIGFSSKEVCASGTSFAVPFLINSAVMEMLEVNPELTNRQITEILLKTVFIPSQPLPVKSGGILVPERAILAAQILAEGNVEVSSAALSARSAFAIEGESDWDEARLRNFWISRGI